MNSFNVATSSSLILFFLIIQFKHLSRRHKPDKIKDFQEDKDSN